MSNFADFDKSYLTQLVEKAEKVIGRKIRYLLYAPEEAQTIDWTTYTPEPLLLWSDEAKKNDLFPKTQAVKTDVSSAYK